MAQKTEIFTGDLEYPGKGLPLNWIKNKRHAQACFFLFNLTNNPAGEVDMEQSYQLLLLEEIWIKRN